MNSSISQVKSGYAAVEAGRRRACVIALAMLPK